MRGSSVPSATNWPGATKNSTTLIPIAISRKNSPRKIRPASGPSRHRTSTSELNTEKGMNCSTNARLLSLKVPLQARTAGTSTPALPERQVQKQPIHHRRVPQEEHKRCRADPHGRYDEHRRPPPPREEQR